MRIPSQFSEDSLYRRGPRRSESAKYQRRLLRLVIALGIVLVVMRQASQPAIYRPFLQRPATQPELVGQSAKTDLSGERSRTSGLSSAISPQDRDIANQFVATLSVDQQHRWIVALSRLKSRQPVQSIPPDLATIDSWFRARIPSDDAYRLRWESILETLRDERFQTDRTPQATQEKMPAETQAKPSHAVPSSADTSSADPALIDALLASLDAAAANRVVDGSVWREGDFDLFYRYLDQANQVPSAGVATTAVLPLLQQPDVFRNQVVQFHGSVALAERIQAGENPYGIDDYWQLWLRPTDGADRPLVAIVREVPEAVSLINDRSPQDEGPQVAVVGRFLKRLAYQSTLGADLAPVLVGRLLKSPGPSETAAAASFAKPDSSMRLIWIAGLAAAIGFCLAAIAMWRTAAMAKRTRRLRAAHRQGPDQFLSELRESSSDYPTNQVEG